MANVAKREDGRWRARYRDESGREHSRHFARKVDATRWLDEITASIVTGQYVDPNAGRISFCDYAEQWRVIQAHRPSSTAHVETMLRRHAYPTLGDMPLSSVLPSHIQAWVKKLEAGTASARRRPLAPSTISVVHSIVSSVFKSAVRDRRVVSNPCEGTKLPKAERRRVVPLTTEQVEALTAAMPGELASLVTVAAGTGMRQGELFGLTVDRLDMVRREVVVDRQLVGVMGQRARFGPPKTAASNRVIPMPQVVLEALVAQLREQPPGADGLLFTFGGAPITRQSFGHLWRPVARSVGLPVGTGLHACRHYYASLLIRHGESVKTVQARLGHASAVETLDTYSHLWPDSDDRTREAIDLVLRGPPADYLRTKKPKNYVSPGQKVAEEGPVCRPGSVPVREHRGRPSI